MATRKKSDKTLNSDTKVNPDALVKRIKPVDDSQKPIYQCVCCGKKYVVQKNNFSVSYSPLFKANNGYIPICNHCRDTYYASLVEFFDDNEEKAIDRMCALFDWYYNDTAVAASERVAPGKSRISVYPSKMTMIQVKRKGTSYMDTLRDRQTNIIESIEQLEEMRHEGLTDITKTTMERWGVGLFEDNEYKSLDEHYKMLKRQNPNADSNQEIFIKDLCYIKLQQMRAIRDKKPDEFKKFTQLYHDSFKEAGLKNKVEEDNSANETLGVTLDTISQYTPEEYYKSKKLYKDWDGLGDYFKRFILRPLKNLQFGTHDRDKEFNVGEDAVDEE